MNGTTTPTTTGGAPVESPAASAALMAPFVRGASEHSEPITDQTVALGSSSQLLTTVDVPAYGFMRHLLVEVTATGGAGGGAVARADAPFNVLSEITLRDVNGQNLVGPLGGFELMLANVWGGYSNRPDPRDDPGYSAPSVNGNFTFRFRIPVQLSDRDGLGSLANTNASATYKFGATVAAASTVFSTEPGTLPNVRVRAWLDAWSPVNATDMAGTPQAQIPPAHGTGQFWTQAVYPIAVGQNTIRSNRVGNLVRSLILVGRTSAGVRSDTVLLDPWTLTWDSRPLYNETLSLRRWLMRERQGITAQSIDAGVMVVEWAHDLDGQIGDEMRDQWLRTLQSSRLEFQGTAAAAGTLTILTNDIVPAGNIYVG